MVETFNQALKVNKNLECVVRASEMRRKSFAMQEKKKFINEGGFSNTKDEIRLRGLRIHF